MKCRDKFSDAYDLLKLNQDKKNNLNTFVTSNGIRAVITHSPAKSSPDPDGYKLYQTYTEELTLMLLKLLHKIENTEGYVLNSFY